MATQPSPTKLNYVAIANLALGHLGEDDRITDPDQDSKAARAIKRVWEGTRQFVLAEAHWSFACRTVDVAQRSDNPDWPIALGRKPFPLPLDLVEFVEIVCPECLDDEEDRYTIEGGPDGGQEICADIDAGPITIRYVRDSADIADPTRWPPAFVEAFAFRLAWQVSDELGADKARKDRVLTASDRALKLARRANARTKSRRRQHSGDWVRSRMAYGHARPPGVAY